MEREFPAFFMYLANSSLRLLLLVGTPLPNVSALIEIQLTVYKTAGFFFSVPSLKKKVRKIFVEVGLNLEGIQCEYTICLLNLEALLLIYLRS